MKILLKPIPPLFIMLMIFNISFAETDQDHTGTGNDSYPVEESSPVGQSFTAGISGLLVEVKIDAYSQICPFNLSLDTIGLIANLHSGDGTNGNIIASQKVSMNIPFGRMLYSIAFDDPAIVTSGNQYTINLIVDSGQICDSLFNIAINFNWHKSDTDSYSGGQAYTPGLFGNPTEDVYFQTVVSTSTSTFSPVFSEKFSFYPNPFHDELNIYSPVKHTNIEILDLTGRRVYFVSEPRYKIDLANLQPGVYFMNIDSESGSTFTKKLIKK